MALGQGGEGAREGYQGSRAVDGNDGAVAEHEHTAPLDVLGALE